MKHNMGTADRLIRTLIAIAIIILYFTNVLSGTVAYVLLAVAAIFLFTSFAGSCPLYSLFGIKTCPVKK